MYPRAQRLFSQEHDNDFISFKERFLDFLRRDEGQGLYAKKIENIIQTYVETQKKDRLVVNLNDLRKFDASMAHRLLNDPTKILPAMEEALKEVIDTQVALYRGKMAADCEIDEDTRFHIAIEGSFGSHLVTPRHLGAALLKRLVCLEGIVTRCSLVRPKVVVSKHWCAATGKQYVKTYHDATSLEGPPSAIAYPTHDDNGNLLSTEYGLSVYKDHQMISIQEMPERAPAGQLPVSIDALLDDDLVDKVKPGDRIHIIGVFRPIPKKGAFYNTVLIANHIRLIDRQSQSVLSATDVDNIKRISTESKIFERLAKSIAPSIYGHTEIKKAVLLMLLGGLERNLPNGTHLRGDINMLLVGDPSVAKSQLLRFVLNIAPLAINTTGKGASGVGLTAAVTTDKETGERILEAGATVLADRGIVCIDEFDKMSEDDRVAIHEVMEQQTVTVSKAGIHTTLNARCSVLAAANPIYGQYNRQKKPTENIGLPDSLLSRFDLLFIVLDNFDPTHDRMISDHVLRMHRYRSGLEGSSKPLADSVTFDNIYEKNASIHPTMSSSDNHHHANIEENENNSIYIQHNRLLHGDTKSDFDLFSIGFLKKYILYAKHTITPTLSSEAAEYIAKSYTDLRSKEDMKTLPVTPRTLDAMIRLTIAHAKSRLSAEATAEDVKAALSILMFALYHESFSPATIQDLLHDSGLPSSLDNENDNNNVAPPPTTIATTTVTSTSEKSKRTTAKTKSSRRTEKIPKKRKRGEDEDDDEDENGDRDDIDDSTDHPSTKRRLESPSPPPSSRNTIEVVNPARLKLFKQVFVKHMAINRLSEVSLEEILMKVNQSQKKEPFSKSELSEILKTMEKDGLIVVSDGIIHPI